MWWGIEGYEVWSQRSLGLSKEQCKSLSCEISSEIFVTVPTYMYNQKHNFCLKSFSKPTPKQWYAEQVVCQNTLIRIKVIKSLMEKAGIEGFYTHYSACYTGGTHLFRAGVQHKLVKEITGHRYGHRYDAKPTLCKKKVWQVICLTYL